MDVFQIVLFISIIIGIFFIIISLFLFNSDKNNTSEYFEASNTFKALDVSISEIDKAMEELNDTSKYIFKEIEEKYQELLFLYSLIDEKKNEIADIYKTKYTDEKIEKPVVDNLKDIYTKINIEHRNSPNTAKESLLKIKQKNKIAESPYFNEIVAFSKEGFSVSEIAKKLNIGQGEVKLILNLERPGDIIEI